MSMVTPSAKCDEDLINKPEVLMLHPNECPKELSSVLFILSFHVRSSRYEGSL